MNHLNLAFQLNTVSFSSLLWLEQCQRKLCQFRGFRNCQIMLSGDFQLGSTGWNVLGSRRCVMCFLWHSVFWPPSCRRGCVFIWECVVCHLYLDDVKAAMSSILYSLLLGFPALHLAEDRHSRGCFSLEMFQLKRNVLTQKYS